MRKLVVAAALLSTALAAPAFARDGAPYVGIDAGLVRPDNLKLRFDAGSASFSDAMKLRHKWGYDVDVVFGQDLGMFRLEGELGYKRASIKDATIDPNLLSAASAPIVTSFDSDGYTRVLSSMVNAFVDLGPQDGVNASIGAGIGGARVKVRSGLNPTNSLDFSASDGAVAWQALAELRTPVSPNVDLGIKARHFETMRLDFGNFKGKYRSNSLLASLVYNFYSPPPPPPPSPPPPPPPPPATQTCPDGSVIPATDTCPAPPAPPPPPPPAPERGL